MSEDFDTQDEVQKEPKKSETYEFPSELNFSLEYRTVPVKLKDPNTDRLLEYTLRELSGTDRDKYLNTLANRMKVTAGGKPAGIKDFKDLQADLVSRSLVDLEGNNVPVAIIQRWPVHVQTELFKMAQKLSALEEADKDEAKND